MKKLLGLALAGMLGCALLCGSALGADISFPEGWVEPEGVTVQLNGETLEFPDALPMLKNDRTFLPFRAVFEALGAEVGFDEPEPLVFVITAKRGDTTVTMVADSPEVTIEKNGVTETITMDVAPYIDPATDRTYVPAYFAATALDCMVGWDPISYTAILAEPAQLVAQAMEGKSYTYLERVASYDKKYREGVWNGELTLSGEMSMLFLEMPLSGQVTYTTADAAKLAMDMEVRMDLSQLTWLLTLMGGETGLDEDMMAFLNAMGEEGMTASLRGDLEDKVYAKLGGAMDLVLEAADEETWYEVPLDRLNGPMGDLVTGLDSREALADWGEQMLRQQRLTDGEKGYGALRELAEALLGGFSDEAFVSDGGDPELHVAEVCQEDMDVVLTVATKRGTVVGYALGVHTVSSAEGTQEETAMTMSFYDGAVKYTVSTTAGSGVTLSVELEGTVTRGRTAPEIALPEGAVVRPLEEAMGS